MMKEAAWSFLPGKIFFQLLHIHWKLSEVFTVLHTDSNEMVFLFCWFLFFHFSTLIDWWWFENSLQLKTSDWSLVSLLAARVIQRSENKSMTLFGSEYSNLFYPIQDKGQRPHIGLQSPKLFISCFLSTQSTIFSTPISLCSFKWGRHITASGSLLLHLLFPQTWVWSIDSFLQVFKQMSPQRISLTILFNYLKLKLPILFTV